MIEGSLSGCPFVVFASRALDDLPVGNMSGAQLVMLNGNIYIRQKDDLFSLQGQRLPDACILPK
ncbi:MAG: hypothetical protein IJ650_00795 [Paludibacteraceae bacterium]|nr:hypothetical protein [Paludibacteraceae bacterium]